MILISGHLVSTLCNTADQHNWPQTWASNLIHFSPFHEPGQSLISQLSEDKPQP